MNIGDLVRKNMLNLFRSLRIVYDKSLGEGYAIRTEAEKELISKCGGTGYLRSPYCERMAVFRRIIQTYQLRIDGRIVVDLGPGHMGFLSMCQKLGTPKELIGVEYDDALISLGKMKNYNMFEANFSLPQFDYLPVGKVDVLFSRASIHPEVIPDFSLWWESLRTCFSSNAQVWIRPFWGRKDSLEITERKREIVHNTLARDKIRIIPAPAWVGSYSGSYFSEIWIRQ